MSDSKEMRGRTGPSAGEQPAPSREVALVIETVVDASIGTLWKALTDPKLVARWLLPNDMAAEEGKRFSLAAPPSLGGPIDCEVIACDPPRHLAYSWRIASPEGELETRVTFRLAERADGRVDLKLVHDGFTVADDRAVDGCAEPEIFVLLPPLRARRLPRRRPQPIHARRAIPLVMRLAA